MAKESNSIKLLIGNVSISINKIRLKTYQNEDSFIYDMLLGNKSLGLKEEEFTAHLKKAWQEINPAKKDLKTK